MLQNTFQQIFRLNFRGASNQTKCSVSYKRRIVFTFIACLRPAFPERVSACSAQCGSFICCIYTAGSLSLSSNNSTGKQPLTFSLAGTRCSRAWANSFSDRSRWTSRPPRPFPSSFPPVLSLYTTTTFLPGSCGWPKLPIQCIFFSSGDSFLSPPPNFVCAARPVLQQTRCWEACVSAESSLNTLSGLQVSHLTRFCK